MKLIITKDYNKMSQLAASFVVQQMYRNKRNNIAITAGNTPKRMYEIIVDLIVGVEYCNDAYFYNFDEIPFNSDLSKGVTYNNINKAFYTPANIKDENIVRLTTNNYDSWDDCIKADGGLDLMVIGIGTDGHYCGNLPGKTNFSDLTRRVDLSVEEKEIIAFEFDDRNDIPDHYVTMGPRSVMASKRILLIVNGIEKAEIMQTVLRGEVDPNVPASILLLHPDLTIIMDEEAASLL